MCIIKQTPKHTSRGGDEDGNRNEALILSPVLRGSFHTLLGIHVAHSDDHRSGGAHSPEVARSKPGHRLANTGPPLPPQRSQEGEKFPRSSPLHLRPGAPALGLFCSVVARRPRPPHAHPFLWPGWGLLRSTALRPPLCSSFLQEFLPPPPSSPGSFSQQPPTRAQAAPGLSHAVNG